jgi:hypothetical protein
LVSSILDFDKAATAKSFGYKTVHEYYRFCSCAFDIPYIEIPSLLLTALDDPIVSRECIPHFEIQSNPHIVLATTEYGGHLGFFRAGIDNIIPTERWFPKPVGQFIHAVVESRLSLSPGDIPAIDSNIYTGTPWYSIPADVKNDRQVLKIIKNASIEQLKPSKTRIIPSLKVVIARLSGKVIPLSVCGLIKLMFSINFSKKNALFFILGYLIKSNNAH